jgi:2-polyprenyl-3-methyl-5-hydroxy-6-metoxy-1,4-benzoquinol methylase
MTQASQLQSISLPDEALHRVERCAACGSTSFAASETITSPRVLTYSRCVSCNLIFMNPMPAQEWYDSFYASQFWEIKWATRDLQERKEVRRALDLLRFLGSEGERLRGGAVLEIGCAFGLVGRTLADNLGMIPLGIEPSGAAREFAEKHGVTIIARTARELKDWEPKTPVKLVVLPHVLENIIDPESTLRLLHDKIDPEGLLIIETPNPIYMTAVSLFHPYVYSKHALSRLLMRCAFDVIKHRNCKPSSEILPVHQRFLSQPCKSESPRSVITSRARGYFPMQRKVGIKIRELLGAL